MKWPNALSAVRSISTQAHTSLQSREGANNLDITGRSTRRTKHAEGCRPGCGKTVIAERGDIRQVDEVNLMLTLVP